MESIVVALIMMFAGVGGITFNLNPKTFFNNINGEFNSNFIVDFISSRLAATIVIGSVIFALLFTIVRYLIINVLSIGGHRFFLKISKSEHSGIGEVIGNFRDGNYGNITIIMFVKDICNGLWYLLFIIPGIIKTFEYAMIPFILAVRPDIDRKEAFRLSKTLMDGHKFDLFVLELSFIGWQILNLFTCGILNLVYTNPYIKATEAEFFYFVRQDAIVRGAIYEQELPSYGMFIANDGFYYDNQNTYNNTYDRFEGNFNNKPNND